MNESNHSDAELAELLTLTVGVDGWGAIRYRNHLGQLHRVLGPAVIHPNGTNEWWLNGQQHRTDGPAVERANGAKMWYVNGRWVTKAEHKKLTYSV